MLSIKGGPYYLGQEGVPIIWDTLYYKVLAIAKYTKRLGVVFLGRFLD